MQRNNSAVINIGIPIDLYDWNFDKRNSCFYIFEIGGGNTFEEAFTLVSMTSYVSEPSIPFYEDQTPGRPVAVHNGDLVDRGIERITLEFSRDLTFPSVAKNISLQDSQGQVFPWQVFYISQNKVYINIQAPLAVNETYTLRIKGGTDGVLDVNGNPLPNDITWQFFLPCSRLYTVSKGEEDSVPG